jgi:hypothetical protein
LLLILIVKKYCFVKEKTEKKKALKQRMQPGRKHQIARGIKERFCVGADVFMPNDLVSA